MKFWTALWLAFLLHASTLAQSGIAQKEFETSTDSAGTSQGLDGDPNASHSTTVNSGTRLRVAYLGSIIYPGASAGLEFPIKDIEIHKARRRGERLVFKEHFLSGDLSMYNHVGFHSNVYLTGSYHFRRISQHGFFADVFAGIGLSRTFFGGTTYLVDANGQVKTRVLAGHFYFAAVAGTTIGKDLLKTQLKLPIAIYCKPTALLMMPYAGRIYWRPTLEVGISFQSDRLLSHSIPNIIKYRKK